MINVSRKIIAYVFGITLIVTMGVLCYRFFFNAKTGDIIESFENLNRLEVKKVTSNTDVEIDKGKNKMVARAVGDIYITVDFDKAIIKSMDKGKKIYFRLPEPETSKCTIHEDLTMPLETELGIISKIEVLFSDGSSGAELYKSALEKAQRLLEEKVKNDKSIMMEAKRNTENTIKGMCSELGVTPIINWM